MARLRLVLPAAVVALALGALAGSGVVAQQSGGAPPAAPAQSAPGDNPSVEQFGPGERGRGGQRGGDRPWDPGNPDDWAGGDDQRSFEDYAGWVEPRRRWRREGQDDDSRWRRDDWRGRGPERRDFGGSPGPRDVEGGEPRGPMMGSRGMGRLCGPNGGRMIGVMLDRLERITNPIEAQRAVFDRLKEAAAKAQEIVRTACPEQEPPLTPPGRLAAAEKQLEARLQAIRTVRPALDEFYAALSEEQKARLYAVGPRPGWREHIQRWREQSGGGEGFGRQRPDGDARDSWRDERRERRPDDWRDQGGDRPYDGGRGRGERWRDDDRARPDRRDYDRDGWPDQWRGRS